MQLHEAWKIKTIKWIDQAATAFGGGTMIREYSIPFQCGSTGFSIDLSTRLSWDTDDVDSKKTSRSFKTPFFSALLWD